MKKIYQVILILILVFLNSSALAIVPTHVGIKRIINSVVSTPIPEKTTSPQEVLIEGIPEGLKSHYSPGAVGNDITKIKERLQKLGYYIYGASMSNEYNNVMIQRVKLFQENNGIEPSGELTEETMRVLWSDSSAVRTNAYVTPTPKPTNTPKPTSTPYKEPKYLLDETGYGEWGRSYGCPYISIQVVNNSKSKTVDGVTLEYFAKDVYGEIMRGYGFSDQYYTETFNLTIKPGRKAYTPKIMAYQFEKCKYISIRISKIHLTDGTTISYPQAGITSNGFDARYWDYKFD